MHIKHLHIILIAFFIFSCSSSDDMKSNDINLDDININGINSEDEDPSLSISQNWEIAIWKDFSKSAISHTWDDNTSKQLSTAMPIYDEFNFKTTFFVANLWNPDWSKLKEASNNEHEIGSHTLTHTSFDEQSIDEIKIELEESKRIINEKMGNENCVSFAYPYCTLPIGFNQIENYYIAARVCNGSIVSNSLTNFVNVSSFLCGTESNNTTAANFNAIADNAVDQKGWGVYLFHGIDDDGGWSPIESTELREHLIYLNANKDNFWVATFGDVVKYMKERQNAILNQTNETGNQISASLTDDLNNTIYNYPLTIKKEIPQSWGNIIVKQNNQTIDFQTFTIDSKKYVTFEAIPDVGEIQILKN